MIASMNTPASKSTEPSAQIVPAPTQPLAAPVESALPPLAATAEDDSAAEAIARALAEPARTAEEAVARPLILVVHASVGSGHRSAANAIAEALEEAGEAARAAGNDNSLEVRSEVRVLDILDFGRIVFDGDKTASMFTGWTRPFYDLTWRYTLTGRLLWGGGTIWARLMYPKFTEYVRRLRPAATDYEAEGLWPHLHTDLFCVANESMAETLRPRRVPEDRILITGIPASPAFSRTYDRAEAREAFGLPQDKQVVLALAGAKLPQPYVHFRAAIGEMLPFMHAMPSMQLVIVAGADEDYERELRRQVAEYGLTNVTVLGYVNAMAELMEAADVVICKPGGLTVTECLCAHAPMILLGRAYGQEKANVRMLTAAGAAMAATTPRELLDTLRHISDHSASAHAMLMNASILRRPNAAEDIARATFALIRREPPRDAKLRAKHFLHFYWGKKPAHVR